MSQSERNNQSVTDWYDEMYPDVPVREPTVLIDTAFATAMSGAVTHHALTQTMNALYTTGAQPDALIVSPSVANSIRMLNRTPKP